MKSFRQLPLLLLPLLLTACGDPPQVAIFPPATPEELDSGMDVFRTSCALCHGSYGAAASPTGIRTLTSNTQLPADTLQLAHLVLYERGHADPASGHSHIGQALSDKQIAAVLTWLRHLRGLPPLRTRTVAEAREAGMP